MAGNGVPDFSGDGGPAKSASLNAPAGLAVDSAGNIWFADVGNNRVRKLTLGPIAAERRTNRSMRRRHMKSPAR